MRCDVFCICKGEIKSGRRGNTKHRQHIVSLGIALRWSQLVYSVDFVFGVAKLPFYAHGKCIEAKNLISTAYYLANTHAVTNGFQMWIKSVYLSYCFDDHRCNNNRKGNCFQNGSMHKMHLIVWGTFLFNAKRLSTQFYRDFGTFCLWWISFSLNRYILPSSIIFLFLTRIHTHTHTLHGSD